MMWKDNIIEIFGYGIFIYSLLLLFFYFFIAVYSLGGIRANLRKNGVTDFRILAASTQLPGISILAPAYNESANIIENVRSLLSLHYNAFEVIIINDGSKDNSLQKLIRSYDLYKTTVFINEKLATKKIRGIYKSNNPVFHKLIVVDKENGGKADALNVGVNVARNQYIVCIDVDCILEQDALLKMIKPFLEETVAPVIASGGVIRIANDCTIENGKLVKINLPKKFLPRVQTIEYIRAFLLGRMAWSRLNGLLLISGAFGIFDKDIVIKCGGYNTKTVGEDMELVVRMRRYMLENKLPYTITFIPDPLCWTEAPSNYKILGRQRNRWTRGTIETLWLHKKMFFNPTYGLLGMVSYPYWFFFEFLAPVIEFIGFCICIILACFGLLQWHSFVLLLLCILSLGFLYSVFAILIEVLTFNQYKGKIDILKLVFTAFLEPFIFHPVVVWSAIKGNIDYIRKRHSWGDMTRVGLGSTPPVGELISEPLPEIAFIPEEIINKTPEKKPTKFLQSIKEAAVYSVVLVVLMLIVNIYEFIREAQQFGTQKMFFKAVIYGLINDISFLLNIAAVPVIIFILLFQLSKKTARFFFIAFSTILILLHATLVEYFLKALVPLGADLFSYSIADIKQTVGAAGVSLTFLCSIVLMLCIVIATFVTVPKKIQLSATLSYFMLLMFGLSAAFSLSSVASKYKPGQELSNNIALNKSYFFINSSYSYFFPVYEKMDSKNKTLALTNGFKYIDETRYPFLHTVDVNVDAISPFFNKQTAPPNIVFIVVEGLGRAFSNKDAYLGSFTPFLDSLSEKSLYWSNFLSAGGRTFAMLPSIFGSLPYGKNGFTELGERMPKHVSLLSVLKQNGYSSNFFYGGNSSFDNMDKYLNMSGANIYDEKTFSTSYHKMPSENGFSWGYGDAEVFGKCNEISGKQKSPTCNIIMTLSTHNPFLINEQDKYNELFETQMQTLHFKDEQKIEHRQYKNQYASILYADNSIRDFMKNYSLHSDFNNTIFIITGDHCMPEIPMGTKLDRYHVPLIIYSPLLKRPQTFSAMSSHLDITPSLLAFLSHGYNLKTPTLATWMGQGLDTTSSFRNTQAYPLIQTKNDLVDYIMDEYMLNGNDLYKITNKMGLEPVDDAKRKAKLQDAFARFRQKNNTISSDASMVPDSLLRNN